ncbi:MAG: hypothetical protein Q9208_002115 [Pyrenodesmia sp. 3 TL-2023]
MSTSGIKSGPEASEISGPNAYHAHVEPLLPIAETALSQLEPLLAQIGKTKATTKFTTLREAMKLFEGLKDTLEARVSEYDTGLQALKDGHHVLTQKCKDREQQLSGLELTYKSKLEEETILRSTIAKLQQDHSLIEPKLRNSRASLAWVQQQEKTLNDSIKSVNDKRAQDDAELETKRASIQKEREEVDVKLGSITQKHQEHNKKVAELEDRGRATAQAVNQNKLQLAILSGVMHTLRSSLDLLGSPSTFESIGDDAEAIADLLQKKLESWKTQAADYETDLANKNKAMERLTLQLKEARTAQRKETEAKDASTTRNNELQTTIDLKIQELEDMSDLTQLLEIEKARAVESLSVVQKDLDDKQKEVNAFAVEKGRADQLQKRLQSEFDAQEAELQRLDGIELQARQSDAEVTKLQKELAFFQDQKPSADWETEVSGLREQIKNLASDKNRADKLDACNEGLRVVLLKQGEDRMKLARQIISHEAKARNSASGVKKLNQELEIFREQKPLAEWEAEVLRLTGQVTGLTDERINLTTRNQSLQTELNKSKSEAHRRESRIAELDARVRSLGEASSAYKTEIQKLQEEARKEKKSLTESIVEVRMDRRRLRSELSSYQQQKPVAQWEQELTALASQVKVLNDEKQRLEDVRLQRNRLQQELNAFKQQKPVAQWEHELSELNAQVTALNGDKQRSENLHASDQDEIARLSDQVKSLQTKNGKLANRIQGVGISKQNLKVLEEFLREQHVEALGPMDEQLHMNTIMAQFGTYVQSQKDLNRMVEQFYEDVAPAGPVMTPAAALEALRTDFSAQRNTVARLKSERKGLELAQGQKEKELKQELLFEREDQKRTIRDLQHRIQLLQRARDDAQADKAVLQDRVGRQDAELKEARSAYEKLSSPKDPGPGPDDDDDMETLQRQLEAAAEDRVAKEAAEKETQRLQQSLTSLKRELIDAEERLRLQSSDSETLQDKVRRLEAELAKTQQQLVDVEANAQRMTGLEQSHATARNEAMVSANDIIALRAQIKESDHQHRQAMADANAGFQMQISSLKRQYLQPQSASSTSMPEVAAVTQTRTDEVMSEAAEMPRRRTNGRSQTPDSLPRRTDTDSHDYGGFFQDDLRDSEDDRPIRVSRKRRADSSDQRQGTHSSVLITNESAGCSNLTGQPITRAGPANRSEVSTEDELDANRRKRLRKGTTGFGIQLPASSTSTFQQPASNTSASGGPVNEPPWNVDDVRQPGFQCSIVPARIVSEIQERIKIWDNKRPDWFKFSSERPKCVEQLVLRKKYSHDGEHTCQECIKTGQICVKLPAVEDLAEENRALKRKIRRLEIDIEELTEQRDKACRLRKEAIWLEDESINAPGPSRKRAGSLVEAANAKVVKGYASSQPAAESSAKVQQPGQEATTATNVNVDMKRGSAVELALRLRDEHREAFGEVSMTDREKRRIAEAKRFFQLAKQQLGLEPSVPQSESQDRE